MGRRAAILCLWLAAAAAGPAAHPFVSKVWVSDNGDGTYKNPVLYADYSDPDVIRVGSDYYLVSSSFTCVPGIPVLHSKDLVNWHLLTYVFPQQPPFDAFRLPRHGGGAWAPSIRYHAGEFWVFYPDPDYGIYLSKARNPAGPWSPPKLIKAAKGWIDPCPFWDDDGKAYLVNAFARSRSGIYSTLTISRMSPDGSHLLDDGVLVYDGHEKNPTVEGPKLYRRAGWYYIFAPAGGVSTGWQLALRSRNIYGPYEARIVLAQGNTDINGPHQGAWVDTPSGESWFLHFQDQGAFGRVVHLEPMVWKDGWPVIGNNGVPVQQHAKPRTAAPVAIQTPPDSDEFNAPRLGLQWQWEANPQPGWALPSSTLGALRLYCVPPPKPYRNLYDVPNLLLQKFPGPEFTITAKFHFTPMGEGDKTGLLIFGSSYAYLAVQKDGGSLVLRLVTCQHADRGGAETPAGDAIRVPSGDLYLQVHVSPDARCIFNYSFDGDTFLPAGAPFQAVKGAWIGAKAGLFALQGASSHENGYADYDWFHVE